MTRTMNIGQAAEAAGVSAKMIRHYEQIGLLPAAARTDAGYRQYGEREVSVLRFIRQARRLGFSIDQIAGLLGLWSDRRRTSREVKAVAEAHLAELERKLREIGEMQQALRLLVARCHGDDDPHCAILDGLAGPEGEAPGADAVGAAARHPRRGADRRAPAAEPAPSPPSHVDLMAWTHGGRPGPRGH